MGNRAVMVRIVDCILDLQLLLTEESDLSTYEFPVVCSTRSGSTFQRSTCGGPYSGSAFFKLKSNHLRWSTVELHSFLTLSRALWTRISRALRDNVFVNLVHQIKLNSTNGIRPTLERISKGPNRTAENEKSNF